jgi:hypothetical protein
MVHIVENGPELEQAIGVARSPPQASFVAENRLREFPCGGVSGAPEVQGVKVARIEFKGLAVAVIRLFISSQEGVDSPPKAYFEALSFSEVQITKTLRPRPRMVAKPIKTDFISFAISKEGWGCGGRKKK